LGFRLGDAVAVTVGGKEFSLPFVKTFGDVPVGKPLLYIDSSELVSVAINQGSFAQAHDIAPPAPFIIAKPAKKAN
jgi:S-adenosylmethionine hydrolase